MGFRSRDLTRQRKQYPPTRRKPQLSLVATSELFLESGIIEFDNETEGSYTFQNEYTSVPSVYCSSFSPTDGIVSLNITSATVTGITVETSSEFTGTVYVQAMQLG